ncbi:hypothetical protein ACET9V_08345 [Aeromonas caviae]|uniref:hypothetical protein n=1 Tax=Aeromonas caviae TaxID=648 RepID=UPI0038D082B0
MAGLWYRSGTIAVTGGSKKVVGTGTTWKSGVYKPDKGHLVWGPDGKPYELDYVESDTVLYLVTAYSGVTATGMAYSIDITRTRTIPAFSRELSAQLAYAQAQYDSWQQILTGSGMVTLTAPDGQQIQVPALSAFQPTSASLQALQDLVPAKDKLPVFNSATGADLITLTPFARTLLDDADAAAARATLGAAPDGHGLGAPAGQGGFRSWVLPQFAFGQDGIADEYLVLFPSAVAGPHCIKGEIHSSRGSGNSGNTNTVERINAQSAFNSNSLYIGAENLRRFLYFSLLSIDGVQYVALKGDIGGGNSHNQLVFYGNVIGGDSKLFTKVRSSDAGVSVVTERLINASNKYHSGNIIGPLSQLGGVPTGAIIEHGSNANGEYVKFADGTMICRAFLTCPSGGGTFNYAATFAVTPAVLLSAISAGPAYAIVGSASQATYLSVVYNSAGVHVTSDIFTVAIGRWF